MARALSGCRRACSPGRAYGPPATRFLKRRSSPCGVRVTPGQAPGRSRRSDQRDRQPARRTGGPRRDHDPRGRPARPATHRRRRPAAAPTRAARPRAGPAGPRRAAGLPPGADHRGGPGLLLAPPGAGPAGPRGRRRDRARPRCAPSSPTSSAPAGGSPCSPSTATPRCRRCPTWPCSGSARGAPRSASRLADAEHELSAYRRGLHERLDAATGELIARYREEPSLALRALPLPPDSEAGVA